MQRRLAYLRNKANAPGRRSNPLNFGPLHISAEHLVQARRRNMRRDGPGDPFSRQGETGRISQVQM